MHLAAPLERRRPFTTSGNKCPQAHEVLSKLATNLTFLTYPARRLDLTRFSIMEHVTGIEPVSQPWQGRIITAILYLHMYQGAKLLCRFERQSPRSHRLRRATHYTRLGKCFAVKPRGSALTNIINTSSLKYDVLARSRRFELLIDDS